MNCWFEFAYECLYSWWHTHLYLGRQYELKIVLDPIDLAKHTGRNIEIHTKDKGKAAVLLEAWYLEKAQDWFHKIAQPLLKRFEKYNVNPNKLEIIKMQYRWGSCSSQGRILLNPELIKAPKACIEYVIVHELCHLVHRDHTKAFFDLHQKEFPEWKKWKDKLENLLA